MATNENLIPIPGRLHSVATEGHVAGADEIFDDTLNKDQATINSEVNAAIGSGGSVDSRITAAINALDSSKSQSAGADGLALNIVEENGKISSISGSIASNTYDAYGAASSEATRAQNAESALGGRVTTLETAVGSGGSVDSRIATAKAELKGSATSACDTLGEAEALISAEKTRAQTAEADRYTKSETYTKTEVNGLVDTPHQEYVTVDAYASLPATGSKDTIYRVSNYDGSQSQVAVDVYSEYAWDGSQYIFLCVKSQIGEVFDITVYNNNTKYADLAAALNGGANIPQSLQKGGMSVKFVQSSDNNSSQYVQYRLMSTAWSIATSDWQGVDSEPVTGSRNLVESGGVFENIYGTEIKSIDWNFSGPGNKDFIDTTNIVSGSKLLIQIISEVQPDINVLASVSGGYQTITKIQDNKWYPVVIPNGIISSQLTFSNVKNTTYDVHVYVRRITDTSNLNYELYEIVNQLNKASSDITINNSSIALLRENASSMFLNYNSLTDNSKKILDSLVGVDFTVDSMFKDDAFSIVTYGYLNGNLQLIIKDDTKNYQIVNINVPLSSLSGTTFKTIRQKTMLYEFSCVVNTSLVNNTMGIISDDPIIITPSGVINDGQFKSFNTDSPNEKTIFNAVKVLDYISNEPTANSDIFKLISFGWTSAGSLYGYISISKNGTAILSKTFDDNPTYPTGVKTYTVEHEKATIILTVDWNELSAYKWYNSQNSQLIIKNVSYALNDASLMLTEHRNLFNINTINPGKYLASTGGSMSNNASFYTTDFIKVEAGKIYKSSVQITRICYYGSKVESSVKRTLTTPNVSDIIIPQTGENYIRFSRGKNLATESVIVTEVEDESDTLNTASLALTTPYTNKDAYENLMIDGYLRDSFEIGNDGASTSELALSSESGEKMFYIPMVGDYDGFVKKLCFYCTCDNNFVMAVGTGIVDQRPWGLVYNRTTVNVINGYNEISVNLPISKGERMFIIADNNSTSANSKLYVSDRGYHQESGTDGITMAWVDKAILVKYTIEGRQIIDSLLADKQSLNNVSQKVSEIDNTLTNLSVNNLFITSPNDTFYKIKVANDGTLSTEAIPVAGKFLIMGNSYDVHDYVPNVWWGDFGMAASRKENDWKHVLLRKLRIENNCIYNFRKQTLANWESKGWGDKAPFDYSTLDSALSETYSMIIIRVGENSLDTDLTSIQARVETLLDYIISKVGSTIPILWGGCVKIRTLQNPAMQAACANYNNVTYVDMEPAGRLPVFAAGLDWRVFGDDNQWHTVSESSMAGSVAGHPRDEVFAKMAEIFYPVVVEKLGI